MLVSVSGLTFENPTDNPAWLILFLLAGPWSGTRPRLAVTLLSDPRPWAELGVHLRGVCSRVIFSFRCEFGQAVLLVSLNMVCINLFEFGPGL
jgi:hypothetical protein